MGIGWARGDGDLTQGVSGDIRVGTAIDMLRQQADEVDLQILPQSRSQGYQKTAKNAAMANEVGGSREKLGPRRLEKGRKRSIP